VTHRIVRPEWKLVYSRATLAVTAVSTVIIPPTSLREFDAANIYIDNDGSDVFSGTIEVSPDGVFPGYTLPDDAFAAMAAGASRYTIVLAGVQFFRVLGQFAAVSGNVRRSLVLQRGSTRPG